MRLLCIKDAETGRVYMKPCRGRISISAICARSFGDMGESVSAMLRVNMGGIANAFRAQSPQREGRVPWHQALHSRAEWERSARSGAHDGGRFRGVAPIVP